MISKKIKILSVCVFVCSVFSQSVFAWGKTGHRVIAEIAERNLNSQAKKGISELLNGDPLWRVATWADEIRSNRKYDYAAPWHYTSVPTGKTYFDQKRSKEGDVIEALFRLEETLRDNKKTKDEKLDALRFMVHLMGDLHQPLHVGLAEDRGGNSVRLRWFKTDTNLHAIWDESIVDFEQLSYTEYAQYLNKYTSDEKKEFAKGTFLDWAKESMDLRNIVYDVGNPENVGYEYHHKVKPVFEQRLRQAGFRLASVLNSVFKKESLSKEYQDLRKKVFDNI